MLDWLKAIYLRPNTKAMYRKCFELTHTLFSLRQIYQHLRKEKPFVLKVIDFSLFFI